jgi:predicted Zn finger-like uncharacterized protein
MIVQCDKCSAKFRLDDSKVKEGGVKVRCSKCSNIFIVKSEPPAEETDFDSFLSGLMPPPQVEKNGSTEAGRYEVSRPVHETPEVSRLSGAETPAEQGQAPTEEPTAQDDFDLSEFAFDDQDLGKGRSPDGLDESGGAAGDPFAFGELHLEDAATSAIQSASIAESSSEVPHDEFTFDEEPARAVQEFDLTGSGIDLFGASDNQEASGEAASPRIEAVPFSAEAQDFSFETEQVEQEIRSSDRSTSAELSTEFMFEPESSKLESAGFTSQEKNAAEPTAVPDFTPFDFDDEPAGETVKSGTSQAAVQGVVAKEGTDIGRISADAGSGMGDHEEDLPPLSIASRRKEHSTLPMAVAAVCILVVLLLAAGGFFLVKEGPAAFNKVGLGFMTKWFGMESREEGGIAVRNATGVFLVNKELGEIFAVSGEAVNNFSKPRASIQVRVNLIGAKGEVLAQKSAYCGNPLSRDQLTSLPAAKLETAMSNQFGDSLSNLAVQPGKGIPFVVVLTNVPRETAEFGVEVLGSTVASQ